MKIFTVHTRMKNDFFEDIILVQEGFNIKAALFTVFWSIYNKIWWLSLILIIINFSLSFFLEKYYHNVQYIMITNFIFNFIFGIYANDIMRIYLKYKKYEFNDIIVGKNYLEAEFRFLEKFSNT